jgi:hypothetical protein
MSKPLLTAYFRATRELIRTGNTRGIADWSSMYPVLGAAEWLFSQQDQLRLLRKIEAEPDDDNALDLFMNGDGSIEGYYHKFGFGSATATQAQAEDEANAPRQLPSVGTLAKPAFDLGMIYADSGRQPLTDAGTIARYAVIHAVRIAVDVPVTAAATDAASFMYERGYAWELADGAQLPLYVSLSRKHLSNLDRVVAKLEGRRVGLFGRRR